MENMKYFSFLIFDTMENDSQQKFPIGQWKI